MAYRRCETHGWLETSEYTVDDHGECICPLCLMPLYDFRETLSGRSIDDSPRPRFKQALAELYAEREA